MLLTLAFAQIAPKIVCTAITERLEPKWQIMIRAFLINTFDNCRRRCSGGIWEMYIPTIAAADCYYATKCQSVYRLLSEPVMHDILNKSEKKRSRCLLEL